MSQDRTEKPTQRRRDRAREEGRFPYSQEMTSILSLAVALATLSFTLGSGSGFRALMSSLLSTAVKGEATQETFVAMIRQSGIFFFWTAVPVLAAAAAASLLGSVLQGLPIFGANATGLKWEKLNPMQGLSKLKAKVSPLEWAKILILVGVCSLALYSTMSQFWQRVVTLPAHDINGSNQILYSAIIRLSGYIVGSALVLGVADFFLQRYKFEKSLKMTKDEVKQDMKAMDGDPQVKGKIRQIQRAMARRRMMTRIKDADVIVTNPTHFAVALEYKPETMAAPRVVAKGMDLVAQKIKAKGREYDIPTVENVALARALYKSVDLEQEIPLDLYKAVAEVLAFVFKARKGQ